MHLLGWGRGGKGSSLVVRFGGTCEIVEGIHLTHRGSFGEHVEHLPVDIWARDGRLGLVDGCGRDVSKTAEMVSLARKTFPRRETLALHVGKVQTPVLGLGLLRWWRFRGQAPQERQSGLLREAAESRAGFPSNLVLHVRIA